MAETLTANYSWTKPDPGASANTWGATLNADLDKIDAQVFSNQQSLTAGQSPVGSITMFGGATAPANWLFCNGASLATTGAYAALYAVIGYAFGGSGTSFNLPNLQQRFPLGAGPTPLGQAAGAFSYPIAVANLPSHAHPITDIAHNHGVNQTPHGHADPGHGHGVNDPGHGHNVHIPGSFGYGFGAGVPPSPLVQTGGMDIGASASATGVSIQAAATGIQAANANISLNASGTGLSTTQAVGSGTPLNITPPFQAINFIIRYQ